MDNLTSTSRRRTAHEAVRDTLRHAILSGQLAGGTRLVQADIAAQLDVSTTPVREALRDLAAEGLIRLDAHRGATVQALSLDEVREVYELRRVLEPLAIRRAVERVTDDELDRAAQLQALMDEEDDPGVWVGLNREFHAIFADASRSPRLSSILRSLRNTAAPYVGLSIKLKPSQIANGNASHHELLEACRRRDVERAVEVEVQHLDDTIRAIEEAELSPLDGTSEPATL